MQSSKNLDMNLTHRISIYGVVATELALLSDQRLLEAISRATPIGTSIGGMTYSMEISGTPVFVKKIPLTDMEKRPENRMSTANLFGLPLFCQYGVGSIGSPGFGAWRELAAHTMSTNWVVAGQCPSFPLMYHWRVLPGVPPIPDEHKNIDDSVKYWNDSLSVRKRLEAKQKASAEIVIFLEYFPQELHDWFKTQVGEAGKAAVTAVKMVENNLLEITSFMHARGFLHFDAHFRNILTDGHRLYFTDFGLATCAQFELSEIEADFFRLHRDYDRYLTVTNLVNLLVAPLAGAENANSILAKYMTGKEIKCGDPSITSVIKRYAPVAMAMNKFYQKFRSETRTALFPAAELESVCSLKNLWRS